MKEAIVASGRRGTLLESSRLLCTSSADASFPVDEASCLSENFKKVRVQTVEEVSPVSYVQTPRKGNRQHLQHLNSDRPLQSCWAILRGVRRVAKKEHQRDQLEVRIE